MKVIVLTAGLGTRLRPQTYSKPKPLVTVAGKPMLAHILDTLQPLAIDELICVTGYRGDQIEAFVRENYDMPLRFIDQPEARGQAHAVYLAREFVEGPLLVVFGDGLFDADLAGLNGRDEGVLYVQEVEDPRRFGVAVLENDYITKLVEKPSEPVSNLAVIGVYYLPEANRLMDAITHVIEHNIQTKGEFYLADALQVMLDRGEKITTETVSMWKDCGTNAAVIATNRWLLENGSANEPTAQRSVIIPPVYIAESAQIEDSVIGPHVSIGPDVTIRGSIVKDSVINAGAQLQSVVLHGSLIGDRARVEGTSQMLNVGDTSEVIAGT